MCCVLFVTELEVRLWSTLVLGFGFESVGAVGTGVATDVAGSWNSADGEGLDAGPGVSDRDDSATLLSVWGIKVGSVTVEVWVLVGRVDDLSEDGLSEDGFPDGEVGSEELVGLVGGVRG